MSAPDPGKPVEFRKIPAGDAPAPAPAPATPHVLKGQAERAEDAPHLEYFGEEDVDGFPTPTPRWVAYCPDCGAKLALAEHEACPFFGGPEKDKTGFTVAVHCAKGKTPGPA